MADERRKAMIVRVASMGGKNAPMVYEDDDDSEDIDDGEKVSKESTDYMSMGARCRDCVYFIPHVKGEEKEKKKNDKDTSQPSYNAPMGECKKVDGKIGEDAYCNLFEVRGEIHAE